MLSCIFGNLVGLFLTRDTFLVNGFRKSMHQGFRFAEKLAHPQPSQCPKSVDPGSEAIGVCAFSEIGRAKPVSSGCCLSSSQTRRAAQGRIPFKRGERCSRMRASQSCSA